MRRSAFARAWLWFTLSLLGACSAAPDLVQLKGQTMGTVYSIKLLAPPQFDEARARSDIADALEQVEQSMSTWREDSEISRFNRSASSDWFAVSVDFARVVAVAQEVSELSGGAFDVTVAPLIDLWGFGAFARGATLPSVDEIAAQRARVGYRKLAVRETPAALRKHVPGLALDLSAIAKGFAVDKVAAYLEAAGVADYLVEIGGEIKTLGNNERGEGWRVGIERPLTGERSVQRIIAPGDRGVATSGDYRNYFVVDGVRYAHALDPRTGRPVMHALASVTVLDETVMRADALATALLVLGPDAGFALASDLQLPAYFVLRSEDGFSERYTPSFAGYLKDEVS